MFCVCVCVWGCEGGGVGEEGEERRGEGRSGVTVFGNGVMGGRVVCGGV